MKVREQLDQGEKRLQRIQEEKEKQRREREQQQLEKH